MENPESAHKRFFFLMGPEAMKLPLVVLATIAMVIASQALVSGVLSLTQQSVQLDYLPRIRIEHTSRHHVGQIYVPLVNWLLMIACVGLVLGFLGANIPKIPHGGRFALTVGAVLMVQMATWRRGLQLVVD